MKALIFLILLAIFANVALAAPKGKPDYVTTEEVQAMINAALAPLQTAIADLQTRVVTIEAQQPNPKPVEPPIELSVGNISFTSGRISIHIDTNMSKPKENWIPIDQNPTITDFQGFDGWGIAYLPEYKIFGNNIYGSLHGADISFFIPELDLAPGLSIPIELHCFYCGKMWDFEFIASVPTERYYTSVNVPANGNIIKIDTPPGNFKIVVNGTYH